MKPFYALLILPLYLFTGSCSKNIDGIKTEKKLRPIAHTGGDKLFSQPALNVQMNGSGLDPDGYIVSFQWQQLAGPAGVNMTSGSTAVTTMSFPSYGFYVVSLTVKDNDGLTDTKTAHIAVDSREDPCLGCWDY